MTRVRTLTVITCAVLAGALPATASAKPIKRARWLAGVTVTEYYPVPEAWFVGQKVAAPGLSGKHRIDWLYSATGVSMEGDGLGLDGRQYHIDALGRGGWVTDRGKPSTAGRNGWKGGSPVWRAGAYWLTRSHRLTFPLDGGGWSNGTGKRYVPLPGVSFAAGPSLPLRYYESVAVDPQTIPLGSRVYIAAYRNTAGHGWFRAEDTGGAIVGHHVDVYRSPPASADSGGNYYQNQRIYVIPPGRAPGRDAPSATGTRQSTPGAPSGGASAP
ncbi:MAG TPA: 3D domain-containing protein [Conexibacter sp.]|nr:3D domain-containing protein [Conexibacter sp.]